MFPALGILFAAAVTLVPNPPPGTVVQRLSASLDGTSSPPYLAIVSSKKVGTSGTQPIAQLYLSLYREIGRSGTYKRVVQSPGPADPLKLVPPVLFMNGGAIPASGASNVTIVGSERLDGDTPPGSAQLVVSVHEQKADCGIVQTYVLETRAVGLPLVLVSVSNYCSLSASLAPPALVLKGPYYSPTAALCCPTTPSVSAKLTYAKGTWTLAPPYFTVKKR